MKTINYEFTNNHTLRIPFPQDETLDRQLNRADSEIFSSLMDILDYFGYDPMRMDEIREVKITF